MLAWILFQLFEPKIECAELKNYNFIKKKTKNKKTLYMTFIYSVQKSSEKQKYRLKRS